MEIRAASQMDAAAVVACATQAFASTLVSTDWADAEADKQLNAQVLNGAVSVILSDEAVLGYITLWPAADHLFIDSVAVLPGSRDQGLGSLLLLFAEHEAARRRLGSIRLFTMETMADNRGFYERRGYRETGRCNDDGFARVFYRKEVTPELPPGKTHVDARRMFARWLHWLAPQHCSRSEKA